MKLLGFHNGKQIITSIAHYDYRSFGEGADYIMADGGIPGTLYYAGYIRCHGRKAWFEVPQTYAELFNDYNSLDSPRKYGLWNLEDVRILSLEEIPDTESLEWRAENAIWGTNGLDGKSLTTYVLLKDCELDHLEKIAEICERRLNDEMKELVDYWIDKKKSS